MGRISCGILIVLSVVAGCGQPSSGYDIVLFDAGTALLRAHGQPQVSAKIGDLFRHNGDGVCIAQIGSRIEMLERNSGNQFHSVIPDVVRQTQGSTDEEDWNVVFVARAQVKQVLRMNGWHSRVTVNIRLPDGRVVGDDGCFSAMDTAEIEEAVLNGKKGLAITLSRAASSES